MPLARSRWKGGCNDSLPDLLPQRRVLLLRRAAAQAFFDGGNLVAGAFGHRAFCLFWLPHPPMKKRRYNLADRQQVSKARRAAVLHLRSRGFTFKTIGYAIGNCGPQRARQIYQSALRRFFHQTPRQDILPVSPDTIARFTRPNITSKHTA